jgi:hypothetical protein
MRPVVRVTVCDTPMGVSQTADEFQHRRGGGCGQTAATHRGVAPLAGNAYRSTEAWRAAQAGRSAPQCFPSAC